jgi:hypothetical protein
MVYELPSSTMWTVTRLRFFLKSNGDRGEERKEREKMMTTDISNSTCLLIELSS